MKYVIIGVGAAGIMAAKTIRKADKESSLTMISLDAQVHSRCMLHKYLSHERNEKQLSFIPENFFEENQIIWNKAQSVKQLHVKEKQVELLDGTRVEYDKLLIATGANSFIPPVGNLREAKNVFGLRHLSDAQAIDQSAKKAENIVIIGSGLVGLDAAYGLMETGKNVSIVEMADRILPVQLDKTAAKEYQKRFESAGAKFYLGRKAAETKMDENGKITTVILDNGEELKSDLIIVAAGVRSATAGFETEEIIVDRGMKVDEFMQTGAKDVYAAGDVTGLSGIWPNAMKQGQIAALNMCGIQAEYTDRYAMKNTMNFYGLVTLSLGRGVAEEGDIVLEEEDAHNYRRAIIRDGKLDSILLQGKIDYSGIYQYLIKNQIDLSGKEQDIFHLSFADFYGVKENGAYCYQI